MKRTRRFKHAIAAMLAAAVLAPGATAQEVDVSGLEPLEAGALSALRGGYFTVDGITFDFGAVVRTTIDGQPALETRLRWSPEGVVIEDRSTLTLSELPGTGGWGVDLSDASGTTLVGHRLLAGELQGFILNGGDNRNLRQDLEITLVLPGFETMQGTMLQDRLGMAIAMDISDNLVRATGP